MQNGGVVHERLLNILSRFMKGPWFRIESHEVDALGLRFGKLGCLQLKFELFENLHLFLLFRIELCKGLELQGF